MLWEHFTIGINQMSFRRSGSSHGHGSICCCRYAVGASGGMLSEHWLSTNTSNFTCFFTPAVMKLMSFPPCRGREDIIKYDFLKVHSVSGSNRYHLLRISSRALKEGQYKYQIVFKANGEQFDHDVFILIWRNPCHSIPFHSISLPL